MTSFTNIDVTGGPAISVSPVGNSVVSTYTSAEIQTTTAKSNDREFLLCVGFNSNTGSSAAGNLKDKVAIYSGIEATTSSGDVWSMNPLVEILGGAPNSLNGQGLEVDINNNNANRGETSGSGGITTPFVTAFTLSGAGSYRSTAAALVWAGPTPIWNRGFCVNSSVAQQAFCDYSTATTSVAIEGSHTYGLDLYNSSTSYPIRLGNTQAIWSRNGANSGQIALMWTDGSDNIWMGQSSPNIITMCSVLPAYDNTYYCGAGSNRWAGCYALGFYTSSDPSLKKDVAGLPSVLSLIEEIQPKTFKWKVERNESVEQEEEQLVQAVEWIDERYEEVELRDGKPTLVVKTRKREELVFDDVPVVDDRGQPVYDELPEGLAVQSGERRQRLHRTPRMVKKLVKTRAVIEHPGTRTHWGFMAPEVKASFDKLGMDFGGHVQDEDGRHHLAPNELVAVLWKGVQELAEANKVLASRVSALEALR